MTTQRRTDMGDTPPARTHKHMLFGLAGGVVWGLWDFLPVSEFDDRSQDSEK